MHVISSILHLGEIEMYFAQMLWSAKSGPAGMSLYTIIYLLAASTPKCERRLVISYLCLYDQAPPLHIALEPCSTNRLYIILK